MYDQHFLFDVNQMSWSNHFVNRWTEFGNLFRCYHFRPSSNVYQKTLYQSCETVGYLCFLFEAVIRAKITILTAGHSFFGLGVWKIWNLHEILGLFHLVESSCYSYKVLQTGGPNNNTPSVLLICLCFVWGFKIHQLCEHISQERINRFGSNFTAIP